MGTAKSASRQFFRHQLDAASAARQLLPAGLALTEGFSKYCRPTGISIWQPPNRRDEGEGSGWLATEVSPASLVRNERRVDGAAPPRAVHQRIQPARLAHIRRAGRGKSRSRPFWGTGPPRRLKAKIGEWVASKRFVMRGDLCARNGIKCIQCRTASTVRPSAQQNPPFGIGDQR
jgi:hypothetical protein